MQGLISIINWLKQNRLGYVKDSTGNEKSKELTSMTHGHELKKGIAGGKWGTRQRGQRGKNWDNCNSITNKIYFKKNSVSNIE